MIRLAVVGTSGYAGYLMERMWELPERCQVVAATSLDAADHPSIINCVKRNIRVYHNLDALISAVSCPSTMVVRNPKEVNFSTKFALPPTSSTQPSSCRLL